jgi:hypothetical protein
MAALRKANKGSRRGVRPALAYRPPVERGSSLELRDIAALGHHPIPPQIERADRARGK